MLEVLGQPYIRAASAKGVQWREVVVDHALPNAAIPTVTIVGFMVGSLVAGAVVVESVFAWPGVGRLLVSAVANRDLAVVQAILLLVAAYDGDGQPHRRHRSTAGSIRACAARRRALTMAVTRCAARAAADVAPLGTVARFFEAWPPRSP